MQKSKRVLQFTVTLEADEEDGGLVVGCPSLPGCWSQGETEDEVLENISEAIELWLEAEAAVIKGGFR